jgi:hypothetical protein
MPSLIIIIAIIIVIVVAILIIIFVVVVIIMKRSRVFNNKSVCLDRIFIEYLFITCSFNLNQNF